MNKLPIVKNRPSAPLRRGDIYYINKAGPTIGSEQRANRPGVIVSNNKCNKYSSVVSVVYLTTQQKKALPTHVSIMCPELSTALCEQIHSVSKNRLGRYIGHVTDSEEHNLNKALMVSLMLKEEEKEVNQLIPVEFNNQRILTTQQLAENYETEVKRISENYNRNEDRYLQGKHYYLLEGEELKTFKREYANCGIAENINKLYLWTERGALLHAKSLNTVKAWEVYDHLVETYFKVQEVRSSLESLSPQLQLLINMELKQKELEQRQAITDKKLDNIREIVALSPTQWRKDTTSLLNKIALKMGGFKHVGFIYEEAYKLLDQRLGVQLGIRLTNRRKTLALNGACKSKIDRINRIDIIAEDKKLIEGFIAIIKEMAIKYEVDVA